METRKALLMKPTTDERIHEMDFKSVKSAARFIEDLRSRRGYSDQSTAEWRRLSMKLTDCALIQFARRLALRLENLRDFLVGVDEQDFNPKVYILDGDKYCIFGLTKRVDERTNQVTCALGHLNEPVPGHMIDVSGPPTDADVAYALTLIESKSSAITSTEQGRRKTTTKGRTKNSRGRHD